MFEIGDSLRDARIRRGIDIPRCEAETRIRAKYLRAMEEGDFDALPAPAYAKSFLRSYATYLGLDPDLLLDEYAARYEPVSEELELRPLKPLRPRRLGSGPQLLWLALGGILAVVLLVWIGADAGQKTAVPLPPVDGGAVSPRLAPPAAPRPPPRPVVPRRVTVAVTGLGESGSYLEVRRGGTEGEMIYVGTVGSGTSRRFTDRTGLWMRIGWTPNLAVRVNGRVVRADGGTASFLATRTGLRRLTQS